MSDSVLSALITVLHSPSPIAWCKCQSNAHITFPPIHCVCVFLYPRGPHLITVRISCSCSHASPVTPLNYSFASFLLLCFVVNWFEWCGFLMFEIIKCDNDNNININTTIIIHIVVMLSYARKVV